MPIFLGPESGCRRCPDTYPWSGPLKGEDGALRGEISSWAGSSQVGAEGGQARGCCRCLGRGCKKGRRKQEEVSCGHQGAKSRGHNTLKRKLKCLYRQMKQTMQDTSR